MKVLKMKRQLLLAGDSTVTNRVSTVRTESDCCHTGWGQMLPLYTGIDYKVRNFAQSGLTTDTFRQEGHYDFLLTYIKPHDYVLFQFGHNDQKLPELKHNGRYRENLITYIHKIREKNAIPILVTPLARNTWHCEKNEYNDLLFDYAESVKSICQETNTPCIDLHKISKNWIQEKGREQVKHYFYPGDFTHPNDHGAFKIAGFVYEELKHLITPSENSLAWSDYCPSKIPKFLRENVHKHLTREEALKTVRELCSYFAQAEDTTSADSIEIIVARQNGYLLFDDRLDDNITEIDFVKLLQRGLSGRETIPANVLQPNNHWKSTLTHQEAIDYITLFENALNYTEDKTSPDIAGS